MLLSALLDGIAIIPLNQDCLVSGLSLDTRTLKPGQLFLAIKGHAMDGRQYIETAISKGAVAVLVEEALTLSYSVPVILVKQLSQQAGFLASRFYSYPSRQLKVIGITGTSGKTSCTQFLAQALDSLNIPCGIIGTLGAGFWNHLNETGLTTPDAISLQAMLSDLYHRKAQAIAMEVSSHSIQQSRIAGIEFELGVFTNLSQDHLDYHGDMASYAAVKRRFLTDYPVKQLILNADDAYANTWLPALQKSKPVLTYSTQSRDATVYAEHTRFSLEGMTSLVVTPWGQGEFHLPLIGEFNLSNALAVLVSLCAYGLSLEHALKALSHILPVAGRMQTLSEKNKPLVIVDYAHKPDALLKVLQALRAHLRGRLICIFGCGGDRDQGKRPLMASIAETWADLVIVTNDNPRHEKAADIVSQIMSGFKAEHKVIIEFDRSKAIQKGIQLAEAGDCVLIAGKGAEHYQQIGDEKLPFDDAEEARYYLRVYAERS